MDKRIDLITKVLDFIDTSDDDEAVSLMADIYMMFLEVSSSATILMVENKLLNRELDHFYEEEDLKELNEKINDKTKLVS